MLHRLPHPVSRFQLLGDEIPYFVLDIFRQKSIRHHSPPKNPFPVPVQRLSNKCPFPPLNLLSSIFRPPHFALRTSRKLVAYPVPHDISHTTHSPGTYIQNRRTPYSYKNSQYPHVHPPSQVTKSSQQNRVRVQYGSESESEKKEKKEKNGDFRIIRIKFHFPSFSFFPHHIICITPHDQKKHVKISNLSPG
ncbi:hypothetical protein OCU04_002122 [Sclerotinia nivalis]|uniref:Uncharacterized protein n=1 Tax=Sclerotinia nivalis TaxID=352851 RepID=A0A9X0DS53_9HELO|nr:hypothetical protein OCU04_002122 [Sclerotinia nivalis]